MTDPVPPDLRQKYLDSLDGMLREIKGTRENAVDAELAISQPDDATFALLFPPEFAGEVVKRQSAIVSELIGIAEIVRDQIETIHRRLKARYDPPTGPG